MKGLHPAEIGDNTNIQTRTARSIRHPPKPGKKQPTQNYYLKSFIPSTITLWNNIPQAIRTQDNLDIFKSRLLLYQNRSDKLPYKPYLSQSSEGHIHLSRIRMGLSGLNSHRRKYHFINYNNCPQCHTKNENAIHFLLNCTKYAAHRQNMIADLRVVIPQHSNLLANFNNRKKQKELCNIFIQGTGTEEVDTKLFQIIAKFISSTDRFHFN